jgi:hypothetical protein
MKLDNDADYNEVMEKVRYFKIHGKCCRTISYEPLLKRQISASELKNPNYDPLKGMKNEYEVKMI